MLYWGIVLFICIVVFVVSLKALNNILLDDRAGLGSAYTALDMLYSKLETKGELKTWRA